jgi:hypothetical protein
MVETQIAARGIADPRVLEAMRTSPMRRRFCGPSVIHSARCSRQLAVVHVDGPHVEPRGMLRLQDPVEMLARGAL